MGTTRVGTLGLAVAALALLAALGLPAPVLAEPSAWMPCKAQDGVAVSWRWDKLENGAFKAEFKATNSRDREIQVSLKPFFVDTTGRRWVDGGLSFRLAPGETKAGEQLRSHELPSWFHAAPVFGGYDTLVVTVVAGASAGASSGAGWLVDQETEQLRVSWRSVESSGLPVAELRMANLGTKRLTVVYLVHFVNTVGQEWKQGPLRLQLAPKEVREGALADLEFRPVYHSVDPFSAHDRWLASADPPASGGVDLLSVSAQ
ncbi:MAG: hypothetical protein WCG80_11125 [Spirochaetales bacterium]